MSELDELAIERLRDQLSAANVKVARLEEALRKMVDVFDMCHAEMLGVEMDALANARDALREGGGEP